MQVRVHVLWVFDFVVSDVRDCGLYVPVAVERWPAGDKAENHAAVRPGVRFNTIRLLVDHFSRYGLRKRSYGGM